VLGILDAKPLIDAETSQLPKGAGQFETGMTALAMHLREMMGRLAGDYGVTPLAIYRQVLPAPR